MLASTYICIHRHTYICTDLFIILLHLLLDHVVIGVVILLPTSLMAFYSTPQYGNLYKEPIISVSSSGYSNDWVGKKLVGAGRHQQQQLIYYWVMRSGILGYCRQRCSTWIAGENWRGTEIHVCAYVYTCVCMCVRNRNL